MSLLVAAVAAALAAPLPAQGLAVQQGPDVGLFSLAGERVGTLPAVKLDTIRPDPVVVTDAEGTRYIVEDGRLQPWGRFRLAAGAELVEDASTRQVVRGVRTLWRFPRTDPWFVSQQRDLVTDHGARGTRILDVRTGSARSVAKGCDAAARMRRDLVLICGPDGWPSATREIRLLAPRAKQPRVLATHPAGALRGGDIVGNWTWAYVSPDTRTIGAQWIGLCTPGTAFLVDGRTGRLRPAVGTRPLGSTLLGWSPEGQPVVQVVDGCGRALPLTAGIYVGPRLVLETTAAALVWRNV
jgi:hypothetical protein